jgi:hypothetical protein
MRLLLYMVVRPQLSWGAQLKQRRISARTFTLVQRVQQTRHLKRMGMAAPVGAFAEQDTSSQLL